MGGWGTKSFEKAFLCFQNMLGRISRTRIAVAAVALSQLFYKSTLRASFVPDTGTDPTAPGPDSLTPPAIHTGKERQRPDVTLHKEREPKCGALPLTLAACRPSYRLLCHPDPVSSSGQWSNTL